MEQFIVVTTRYGTNEILDVYGPFTREAANNLSMALPQTSHRDHTVYALKPAPVFDFSDTPRTRGRV
jgi:hypothetical protein